MKNNVYHAGALALCLCMLIASGTEQAAGQPPSCRYAVTTSWLECCLRDIAGRDASVVRVCPPGTCPGHFDLTPGSLTDLQRCRLLFLFDFQKSIEEKLGAFSGSGLELVAIKAPEGLCVPPRYMEGCQAVHDVLVRVQPDKKDAYTAALEQTRLQLANLERDTRGQIAKAGLNEAKVIASKHQVEFCRWLGLDVVAAYSGGDTASPAALQSLVNDAKKAHVRLVIANLQEGRQLSEALADQVGAKLVVFSNFPSMEENQDTFEALIHDNLRQLTATAQQ
jgi:ABC-type Zn uptake system ZnuABC Zn-binding protein ZnuA